MTGRRLDSSPAGGRAGRLGAEAPEKRVSPCDVAQAAALPCADFGWKGVMCGAAATLAVTALSAQASATARAVPPPGAVVISSAGSGAAGAGRVLVDASGYSLYDFTGDGFEALTGCQLPTNVSPSGARCTSIWTPVL